MRRSFSAFTSAATASLLAVFMLSACVEGPEGPAGPQGEQGATGAAGADGADANSGCVDCHVDDTRIVTKHLQWEASLHGSGGHSELAGYQASCAGCHSHEGFIDRMESGLEFADSTFAAPSPPNCRTCHKIHTTYTGADFDRQYNESHDLWLTGTTVDFGDGNLCAQCHQPRTSYDIPVLGGGDVTITSSRFGPHHGPQGAILQGDAGYEVGGISYPTTPHFHGQVAVNTKGCVTCHMAPGFGDQAGGHTMEMWWNFFGSDTPNTAGCATSGCHANTADWETLGYDGFDYKNYQTSIENLILAIQDKLITAGIVDPADDGFTSIHDVGGAIAGTYTEAVIGAYWNYITVLEDRSLGVHNPPYVLALLTNTLAALP
jgi:hypothetical protein